MKAGTLARFRPTIASATPSALLADPTLGGSMVLARDGGVVVSYAPFEHVVPGARVVIVGITPGAQQAGNALVEARRRIIAGEDDASVLAGAKVHASFSGQMRDGLVSMLDAVGLHHALGVDSAARLWDSHAHLAHFTSALRYPVLVDGGNYSGNPSMTRTPVLRRMLSECLAEEARALPDALWLALGPTAAKGLDWLVSEGILPRARVCQGLHPSPSNVERVQYFLGTGRARADLSIRTNPETIEGIRSAMAAAVAALGGPAPGGASVAEAAAVIPGPAAKPPADAAPPALPAVRGRREGGRQPSAFGLAIQAAVDDDPRYVPHFRDRLYLCTYETRPKGTVFAFERVAPDEIVLWLPVLPAVEAAARALGLDVPNVSVPYQVPGRYGRIASLEAVERLRDAPLYPIKVRGVPQAMRMFAALP